MSMSFIREIQQFYQYPKRWEVELPVPFILDWAYVCGFSCWLWNLNTQCPAWALACFIPWSVPAGSWHAGIGHWPSCDLGQMHAEGQGSFHITTKSVETWDIKLGMIDYRVILINKWNISAPFHSEIRYSIKSPTVCAWKYGSSKKVHFHRPCPPFIESKMWAS